MALKSVYLPQAFFQNNQIQITGEEHRHLLVARAEQNELLEVFDGNGKVWTVTVDSIGKRETLASLRESRHVTRDAAEVILGLAMIRTAAFELALEKAVEIGVVRIVPFTAARSNVGRPDRHDRWQRIVVEAAKQSKRYYLPALDEPMTLDGVFSVPAVSKIMFAERSGGPLKSALAGSPALYLIGPEGGWKDSELTAAQEHGFHLVSLGSTILKAETAAIVGGMLIRYELEGVTHSGGMSPK